MKQAYLDCSSGISGDMFLAVLIDAGVPVDKLFGELKKLALGFYQFKRTRAVRGGLVGTRIDIQVPGDQPHRKLADIQAILEKAALPEKAAANALKVFNHLAEVEGKLHNVPPTEVHFHEVGAVDAIIDIVGTCVGLELLEVSELICSPLNVGSGRVDAAHGSLPVPSPAAAELLKNIPIYSSGVEGELVTPTGAALVSTLASSFGPFPAMKIAKIGYGAGEKEFAGHPNIARLFVGEPTETVTAQTGIPGDEICSVLEATAFDMTPQAYVKFAEEAMAAGALDVNSSATQTKSHRHGLALRILCEPDKSEALSKLLLEQPNTTDVRIVEARRKPQERRPVAVEAPAADDRVAVIEANAHEMNPQAYSSLVEQATAAGALDVTGSAAQMKNNRRGMAIRVLCVPDKSEALSQWLLQQPGIVSARTYEARQKPPAQEPAAAEPPAADLVISVVEATAHDLNPQVFASLAEQAVAAGALDVTSSATQMKNNRRGMAIRVLCVPDKSEALSQWLLQQPGIVSARTYEARQKPPAQESATVEAPPTDVVISVVEATAHDLSPQVFASLVEQAVAAGALDVTSGSTQMKNGRPGVTIRMLAEPDKSDALARLLLELPNTLGVRVYEARRKAATGEPAAEAPYADEFVSVIEANVDDMSPQLYGHFQEQALAEGALDVTCTSAQMKKNRPGLTISILCEPGKTDELSQLLFEQTTTIGVRIYEARRKVLEREQVTVETPFGPVQVKVARRHGKVVNAAPEFDDCQRLAMEKGVPLKQVIAAAEAAYLRQSEKAASA